MLRGGRNVLYSQVGSYSVGAFNLFVFRLGKSVVKLLTLFLCRVV